MDIAIAGLKVAFGLLLTGGLGFGLIRWGAWSGSVKSTLTAVSDDVGEMKTEVKDLRQDNSDAHEKLHKSANNLSERLVAVETRVAGLPCNGRKLPPPSCPAGG